MNRAFWALLGIFLCLRFACIAQPNSIWERGNGFRWRATTPIDSGRAGFSLVSPAASGVAFTNVMGGDLFLTNAVAHNGSGLALGDVDGDGWVDIYFCALDSSNRLYRNLGDWKFEEIKLGAAACAGQISTAATLVDLDGDHDLDLLVNGVSAGTRLFLNDGKGAFSEVTDSGLSRTNSATSMALADIDGDGDLDLYCAHYIDSMYLFNPTTKFALARKGNQWMVTKVNQQPTTLPKWTNRFEALPDGRVRELPEAHALYRNDGGGKFVPIQNEAFLDAEGKPIKPYRDWGLGAMFRDMNGDGAPDLYVCNDNASPDRIWMNDGRGRFRPADAKLFRHTSRSAMGIDFADLDRDGRDDFIVVDMLAREHFRRMTQLVRDYPDPLLKERVEERPEYNRNTLFFQRPDGTYSERAFYAGVAATDWSWCPIFLDVDLDGYEDLLVSNGFQFDVLDQDTKDDLKNPARRRTETELQRFFQFYKHWPTANAAFRNRGDGTFEPAPEQWGFSTSGVSYGMALGDLDNDGDADLVINNLNEAASVYRNDSGAPRVAVRLRPEARGVGAKIRLKAGSFVQQQEMISGGRYLSSDEAERVFAAMPGEAELEVTWRDGKVSLISGVKGNRVYEVDHAGATAREPQKKAELKSLFKEAPSSQRETVFTYEGQPGLPRAVTRKTVAVKSEGNSFVAERFRDHRYPEAGHAAIESAGQKLDGLGMVTGAVFAELDGNEGIDLAVALDWGPIRVFRNQEGRFEPLETLASGLWSSIVAGDFDGDGRMDLAAGNLGLNTEYALFTPPLRIYYKDAPEGFQLVEAWQKDGNWHPLRDRNWLSQAIPQLPRMFTNHFSFARATIDQILGTDAKFVEATTFASTLFLNREGKFEPHPLPREAQLAPASGIAAADFNGDKILDLFVSQNAFSSASDINRDDDGRGLLLLGKGGGSFESVDPARSGINILEEQRGVEAMDFDGDGRIDLRITLRSGETKLFLNQIEINKRN